MEVFKRLIPYDIEVVIVAVLSELLHWNSVTTAVVAVVGAVLIYTVIWLIGLVYWII